MSDTPVDVDLDDNDAIDIAFGGTNATTAAGARTNLGLGNSATLAVGTTAGTVAAGDHAHTGVYEPADATILKSAAVGSTVQAYDADIPTVSASQIEMEAGTEAALRSMSPLRVAQAIVALTGVEGTWDSTARTAEPNPPQENFFYIADESTWDPLSLGGSTGYFVFCTSAGPPATYVGVMDLAGNWLISSLPAAIEVDGHAAGTLTAVQMHSTVIYNTGQAAADVFLGLPAAAAGLSGLFTVGTAQSNHWGVVAGAGDKIYLVAADGTVAAGADAAAVVMTAAQVGQSFAIWSFKSGASTYDWMAKAICIGTSTFAAHAAP